jgi:hypothetical protein
MMATINVNPGICGLKTAVTVTSEDMQTVAVRIESECPAVQQMEPELQDIDGYVECFSRFGDSRVYGAANAHCKHVACPVPSAILKGIEVACALALPKVVQININKD